MSTSLPRSNIQRILQTKHNSQWLLPALVFKLVGYSSFAAAIVSMIVYWYKKQQKQQKQLHKPAAAVINNDLPLLDDEEEDDGLLQMNPRRKLHIPTSTNAMMMTRSSSSGSDSSSGGLSDKGNSLITPPPSPISSSPRCLSPRSWSSRFLDGFISVATRKRKRMTISLKNTILWNPSPDFSTPMHAFHENAVLLLNKLIPLYDIYIMIHINSDQERHQIHQLLNNASLLMNPRKILYCSSEQGKLYMIKRIQPVIHVEGGDDGGGFIIQQLKHFVERRVWITTTIVDDDNDDIEYADSIFKTCLAKQAGF